jgi:hypothetical protein
MVFLSTRAWDCCEMLSLLYCPSYPTEYPPLTTFCSFYLFFTFSVHSWTDSKIAKVQFYQQMGEWYVNDKCTPDGTQDVAENSNATNDSSTMVQQCCAAEPIIRCHFRDKPSIIPCNDSPPNKADSTYLFHPKKN